MFIEKTLGIITHTMSFLDLERVNMLALLKPSAPRHVPKPPFTTRLVPGFLGRRLLLIDLHNVFLHPGQYEH